MIYRKVLVRVWRDARVRALSGPAPNAQTLWLYLLTSDVATIPGLAPIGALGLAERLVWEPEPTAAALSELEQEGFLERDPRAPLIWIAGALRQEIHAPDNPNVAMNWGKALEHVPECPLRIRAVSQIEELLLHLGDSYLEAWRNGIGKGYGNGSGDRSAKQQAASSKQYSASSTQQ